VQGNVSKSVSPNKDFNHTLRVNINNLNNGIGTNGNPNLGNSSNRVSRKENTHREIEDLKQSLSRIN